MDGVDAYTCECVPGFVGTNCEQENQPPNILEDSMECLMLDLRLKSKGKVVCGAVTAVDPEGGALTWSLTGEDAALEVVEFDEDEQAVVTTKLLKKKDGPFSFEVVACDPEGLCDSMPFWFDVVKGKKKSDRGGGWSSKSCASGW